MASKHPLDGDEPPVKRVRLDALADGARPSLQADQERAVGITAFVSADIPGFSCIVKERYTDFLVNEISIDGSVLHLNSLPEHGRKAGQQNKSADANGQDAKALHSPKEAPAPAEPVKLEPKPETGDVQPSADTPAINADLSDEDRSALEDIFGAATTQAIQDLYFEVLQHPGRKARDHRTIKSEPLTDKSKRTAAHVAVRRIFKSKLETATLQDQPGVISIKAAPPPAKNNTRSQLNGVDQNGAIAKGKVGWSEMGGEYLHFTLYKENKDTMEVLYFLASQLKVPAKNFQVAGTKDRRGVTVQRVAIFRMHAQRIIGAQKTARGWVASDFEYRKHGLELGELQGNEFLLTLRDCCQFPDDLDLSATARCEKIKSCLTAAAGSFLTRGFLNYYGLQRFGTFSTGTHAIGRRMLKGDLEGAVDAILSYAEALLPENQAADGLSKVPKDDIDRADAIRTWRQNSNTNEMVAKMPRRFQAESAIMQYLGKRNKKTGELVQKTDWQGALIQIQRNLRLMYVHAYQSFIWNSVAAKRWEVYGTKVIEGDLVIVGEKDDAKNVKKDVIDQDGELIVHPSAEDSANSAEDNFIRARHLTKEEAESGKYDIFDVVLPLPGFDVLYPSNELAAFYKDLMASEEGGGLDPHNMRRTWREVSLPGSYRKLMSKPDPGFSFEVKRYHNEHEQLVQTDLEKLRNANMPAPAADAEPSDDDKIAVVLKFQLGSSQYATMALRELTKGGAMAYTPDYNAVR